MTERDEFRGGAEPAHSEVEGDANGYPNLDRWARIKELFESAFALEPAERESFLVQQCGTDSDLRSEIDSLLLAHEQTGKLLKRPLASLESVVDLDPSLSRVEELEPGTRIGAYRLEKQIGQGGMGVVYLASRADSEYFKKVAIKLIPHAKVSDAAVSRFRKERQILASIEHPYVARLLDGGTTAAGLPYFVMEYVEGQPLRQYCETRALDVRHRLKIFLKICSAVHHAHGRNVIHRDLKPGNILVEHSGTPKLLDFGIAKLVDPEVPGSSSETTLLGHRMLTPAYASPEQLRGDPATTRSDIYSLGVVLYELLCGERPAMSAFQQDSWRTSNVNEAHIAPRLRAIVWSAMRWDPEERYASVEAFGADIQRYLDGVLPIAASPISLDDQTIEQQISIAILPLREPETETSTHAFLASAITDALITRLSRVERIAVRPTSAVLQYVEAHDTVRAARELRVKYVLEGRLYVTGEQVRVTVQLVSTETGSAVWAAHFDEQAGDLLKLEESISERVSYALIPQLSSEERESLSKRGTVNPRAHESYLRGRWHWTRSDGDAEELAKALVCFTQAIAEDPQYARAHAGLADYYLRLGLSGGLPPSESFAAAIQSAETALQFDPTLAEAHASLAFALWAYHRDYAGAEQHFHLAITRNPNYASAHHWFGLLNSARNRPELAIANLERARTIDPNSPNIAAALGAVYYNARQYGRAIELLSTAAKESKKSAAVYETLAWCYIKIGEASKALDAAERSLQLSKRSPASLSVLAHAEVANGSADVAAQLRDEVEEAARERYVSGYDRASAYLATGEVPNALTCLEQAFLDRDWWVCWIAVDARWDTLRNHPQFKKLVLNTQPAKTDDPAQTAAPVRIVSQNSRLITAIATTLIAVAALAYFLLWPRTQRSPAPFSSLKFTKLTTNGTANLAAISPNGRHVAYTTNESRGTAFWIRELDKSVSRPLVEPLSGEVTGLDFTGNGKQVTFVNYPSKQTSARYLYTVPISGGSPRKVMGTFAGPVSLSFDGTRQAFVKPNHALQEDELWIANVDARGERILATYKYPERLAWSSSPAWSVDGKLLAYALEENDRRGFFIRLVVADTQTGKVQQIPSRRWQWVQHISWSADKRGFFVVGQEHESSFQQIWYVPYPKGETERIGNDLDDYVGVSAAGLGSKLVSVQLQTLSNIYILPRGDPSRSIQITPGSGRYFDLSWTPDDRLLYASDATGSADLWVMNADGTSQHQLTNGIGRSYAPAASPNGKFVAFHSNQYGNWNIWSAAADGSHPVRLTEGPRDSNWPEFTIDSNFIVYHHTNLNGVWDIWRVPVQGGAPVQLTSALTTHPAVSPGDGKIACWYSADVTAPEWKLAVFPPDGGSPLRIFDPAPTVKPDSLLRWTPSGDAITFFNGRPGNYNLWLQPINGRPARPLTSLTSGEIYSFAWSLDGRLAYSRGMTTSDVVLIRDESTSK